MKEMSTCLSEMQVAECAEAIRDHGLESLPEEIREHLRICDKCASEVLAVSDLISLPEVNAERKARPLFPVWVRWGAAAAVVTLFIVGKFVMQRPSDQTVYSPDQTSFGMTAITDSQTVAHSLPEISGQDSDNDSLIINTRPLPESEGLIASYTPDQQLEKLSQRSLTGERSDGFIEVYSPNKLEVRSDTAHLRWRNIDRIQLTVVWYNNKGESVMQVSTNKNSIIVPEFRGGLYYWKLFNGESDLLYCGKVVVR